MIRVSLPETCKVRTTLLPEKLQLISATATGGSARTTQRANTVTWNVALAGGGSITITIQAALKAGLAAGNMVSNHATVAFDADGDGKNESSGLRNDPTQPGSSDPTTFTTESPGNH